MSGTHKNTNQRVQQPVIRGIALERLAAAGMVALVVVCGLLLSPTVRQSAAVFDQIDAAPVNATNVVEQEALLSSSRTDSLSSRVFDRIYRKFEFGIRLVGGSEISTILRNRND